MAKPKKHPFKKVVVEIPNDLYNDLLALKPENIFRKSFFENIFFAGTYIYLKHDAREGGKK